MGARRLGFAVCVGLFQVAPVGAAAPPAAGEYLFRAAGCASCHTDAKNGGAPLAGGRALATPFGVFYSPNITPDPETGVGRWSEADFVRALRDGVSPAGAHYYPSFPYTSYTRLTDADIREMWGYLRSVKPVRQANRPHALPWYARARVALTGWKALFFTPGARGPQPQRTPSWNRGAYLVEAVAHCGECHTPRNVFGAAKAGRALAGTRDGPEGGVVPNITPHKATGIGRWSATDIAYYLETGLTPDGDSAGELMAEAIDNSLRHLTGEDRLAIAEYLRALPAIENAVRKADKAKKKAGDFDY
jgi:mono/diheme cytochrome c family protein